MAKFKELLEKINGLLANNEIEALLGASDFASVMNHDISDETVTEIDGKLKSLLTIEDAKQHPEIKTHYKKQLYPDIKGELLGVVDTEILKETEVLFGKDVKEQLQEIDFTKDKISKFTQLVSDKLAKGSDDKEIKAQLKAAHKRVTDLEINHTAELESKDNKMKEALSKAKNQLTKGRFMSVASSYNWADAYKDDAVKNILIESKYNELAKVAKIVMTDNGMIELKDINDSELDYHEGNKKVDFKTKLESSLKPFIAGTENGHKKEVPKQTYQPSPPRQRELSPEAQRLMQLREDE